MNTELFIARRIIKPEGRKGFSLPVIRISIAGIALGLIVMILTVSISKGFKNEIRKRISIFGSHITVSGFGTDSSWESSYIKSDTDLVSKIESIPGVESVNSFALRSAIVQTRTDVQGIILKGIGKDYNDKDINSLISSGHLPDFGDSVKSNGVLISSQLADLLKLKTGDQIIVMFIQKQVRQRKFTIEGIYVNSMEDFANLMFCDIRHIQKLNDWNEDQVTGFEIRIKNFDDIDRFGNLISDEVGFSYSPDGSYLNVETIKQKYSHLFDWISVFDTNTWVILFLMIMVASFNMISGLLILILERTNMIGVLKALGAQGWNIRKIFLYYSVSLIGKGMFWGNIIGIGLCLIQKYFGLITLDPESYYVSVVPVNIDLFQFLLLNLGTFILTFSSLIGPSYIITRLDPSKAIKFI